MNKFRRFPALVATLSLVASALVPAQAAPQPGQLQAAFDKEQVVQKRVPSCRYYRPGC
jgi:hypothetical protein